MKTEELKASQIKVGESFEILTHNKGVVFTRQDMSTLSSNEAWRHRMQILTTTDKGTQEYVGREVLVRRVEQPKPPEREALVQHGKLVEAREIKMGDSLYVFGEVFTRRPHPDGPAYDNIYVHCVNGDFSKSMSIDAHKYVTPVRWVPVSEDGCKGEGVTCRIVRDGPVTKIAEFYVRGRRYSLNADYLKDEEHELWFLHAVSGILSEVDQRAAETTQHGMQAKLRELIGLAEGRNVFAEPLHVSKAMLKL